MSARAVVTDVYDQGAAADILIKEGGKVQKEVQAKFVKSSNKDVENSAARSVFDQAGGQKGHWGKYKGMDRLIRKDEHYNAEGSMLDEAKKLAKSRAESGSIHAEDFKDVHEHLTDELHYGDASSGGTTFEEVQMAYESPEKYAKAFSGKVEEVKQACTCLGGKQTERLAGADLTFEMPVLPGFSVLLQFWDGDEEFLPKILLLWDKVSLSYLHFETTYYLQGDLLKTILQTIG